MQDARTIVRRFSGKAGCVLAENQVAQAVTHVENELQQREKSVKLWQEILAERGPPSGDLNFSLLDSATDAVVQEFNGFVAQLLPEEQKFWNSNPPSLSEVHATIQQWNDKFNDKTKDDYSTAKTYFAEVCNVLDSYSGLFSFFPSGDKYVSVLCGAISLVVKASVNHGQISKEFASALAKFSRETRFWDKQVRQFGKPGEETMCLLARFYTKIFHFLTIFMRWKLSKGRRFWASLDKNFLEDNIRGPMKEILDLSMELRHEAEYQHRELTKQISSNMYIMNNKLGQISSELEKQREYRSILQQDRECQRKNGNFDVPSMIEEKMHLLSVLGARGIVFLEGKAVQIIYDESGENPAVDRKPIRKLTWKENSSEDDATRSITSEIYKFKRSDIEIRSRHLGDDVQHGFPVSFLNNIQQWKIASQIYVETQAWMAASKSQTLWIRGPGETSVPSDVSLTALYIVSIVTKANIPLIAHCCQGDYDESEDDVSKPSRMEKFVRLLYSLVRQLTWIVPDEFETKKEFSRERFVSLDGTTSSVVLALSLFKDLLNIVPRLLFCVIDGFQLLEDDPEDECDNLDGIAKYLRQFLEILREFEDQKVLKMLFTTNGYGFFLDDTLDDEQKLNVIDTVRTGQGERQLLSRLQAPRQVDSSDEEEE